MKFFNVRGLAVILLAIFSASPSIATERSVVTGRSLDAAVVSDARTTDSQREVISSVLGDPAVQEQAREMGLDPSRLEAMAGTLTGAELAQVSAAAEDAAQALAGGDSMVIGTTTLIIILLILIIVLVAD
jgi:hypothetical protein